MKFKITSVLLLILTSIISFQFPALAEIENLDDQTSITINVGETRVIGNTSISCQANIVDRVCSIREENVGAFFSTKIVYEIETHWQAREKFPSGDGVVTRTSSAGTFATRAEAQARMDQLIKKGYCN